MDIRYIDDDRGLDVDVFLHMVRQVWPREYDRQATAAALRRTTNVTAWAGEELVGCVRFWSDGAYFGTVTEILVLPRYQGRGIGRTLMDHVAALTPTPLYFGAQSQAVGFYEAIGCRPGLPAFLLEPKKEQPMKNP